MFDLTGKVALVTGGSRGIGRATAVALASRGARVVLGYYAREDAARQVVAAIEQAGGQAEALRFDVTDAETTDRAITEAARRSGRLDILVCSAGVSSSALLLELTDAELERLLSVNTKGALHCARSALKTMIRARSGRIVLMSSVAADMGNAGQAAYAASKAAVIGLGKSLAREYADRCVTVNMIAPGFVETDMTAGLSEQQRAGMLAAVPLHRPATAAEVAAAVVYLASEEAAYVTGHTLRVNGGMYV
ncbi:MAG: 3-oxoacyl-ACP reductase FabG [Polyangiaceae bacterium]|nr:3-oxoacyl-ACP reductase FabG [Polyangiaceae bacterium]